MSSSERYERSLPVLLEELAAPRTPAYFDDILGQVDRTRQRPGWTFPERWLPMSAVSERLATAPRVPIRAVLAAALLLVALAVGLALLAGGRKPAVPAPFGPANNGLIAFVDDAGAIRAGLATAKVFDVIVPGPGNDSPVFSPDGTRLLYLRSNAVGNLDIVVAAPDGTGATKLNTDQVLIANYYGWTPDGGSVVVESAPGKLFAYDAAKPGPASVINASFSGGSGGFGDRMASVFRPPLGEEIAFLGVGPEGDGLYVTKRDGSGIRPLLTPKTGGLPYFRLQSPEWSPDGTKIAVTVQPAAVPENVMSIYVLNADGSGLRRLSPGCSGTDTSENFAAWSPDSTRIAHMRWCQVGDEPGVQPITVDDVATGVSRGIGDVQVNGYNGFAWSPDGTSIIEVPGPPVDDRLQVLIVDATTGAVRRTGQSTEIPPTWQRTAPVAP
jgi:Tol biopolymer transport system component